MKGPNATCHKKGPNVIRYQKGPNATCHKKGPNVIRHKKGPNDTSHKKGPNVICHSNGPNATCYSKASKGTRQGNTLGNNVLKAIPIGKHLKQQSQFKCKPTKEIINGHLLFESKATV